MTVELAQRISQELRFNKYCERLQNLIAEVFNPRI